MPNVIKRLILTSCSFLLPCCNSMSLFIYIVTALKHHCLKRFAASHICIIQQPHKQAGKLEDNVEFDTQVLSDALSYKSHPERDNGIPMLECSDVSHDTNLRYQLKWRMIVESMCFNHLDGKNKSRHIFTGKCNAFDYIAYIMLTHIMLTICININYPMHTTITPILPQAFFTYFVP